MVEFGQVQLNFTATKKLRLRNSGAATLTLSKAEFSKALFGVGVALPLSIEVDEELELPLTFTPTTADQRETGTVTLSSDDPSAPAVHVFGGHGGHRHRGAPAHGARVWGSVHRRAEGADAGADQLGFERFRSPRRRW